MIRLSEEQRAILSCYSGNKEEVFEGLQKAIPFIEDTELREIRGEQKDHTQDNSEREYIHP